MALHSGERQVFTTATEVRRDHTARYEFVAKRLPSGSRIVDYACGIGYGSKILADAGHYVTGFDIDAETIAFAREHFSVSGEGSTTFATGNGNVPGTLGLYDAAVSFETIEHIEDPKPLLLALREAAGMLYASVPNEDVMPWRHEDGSTTAFHFRHYTKLEFRDLLEECGWGVVEWHGQAGPDSEVGPNVHGRTLIAVCERIPLPEQAPNQKHIVILGLGPSVDRYTDIVKRMGGREKFCDEVWAINALGQVFDCDMVFHMDDVRIQEIRAAAAPASNIAAMLRWLKRSKVPVMTSREHPDYPALRAFPLENVLNALGHCYFNNTAAYAVAYAIYAGATEISCFGMDFTYPNRHDAEKGRACVEFWLGYAQAQGIHISLPTSTSLLDSNCNQESRMYGYDTLKVAFNVNEDGRLKLEFTEQHTLPTAVEIEARYDHSAPIEQQHIR